ncbi:amidohydrolase [Haloimpatiens sp. FM7315]|uniref:amidohydrolase n=1 Tax=Haloimpatiens sp. FM7315 TaxID=3298609 RepID=UPI00370B0698
MYEIIDKIAENLEDKIIEDRRDFHKYPEIAWTEFRTASIIAKKLENFGYKIELGREVIKDTSRMGVPSEEILEKEYERALSQGAYEKYAKSMKNGYTGVVGILENGQGPTIAARFDIDALSIKESHEYNHLPYKLGFCSKNCNYMHACGHDGHAAIGIGVAAILAKLKSKLKGRIILIFQPAEEGVLGAKSMVDAGILDNVDYLIGGHIGIKARKSKEIFCDVDGFLATSKFDAYFKGKPSHAGSNPEEGNNALLAAATAILNLNAIPRNGKGATRINVGKLISGTSRNIIPSTAKMLIETRGETKELNDYMKDYAYRVLESSAKMHGVNLTIVPMGEALNAESDDELVMEVEKVAKDLKEYNYVCNEKIKFGASEDFSYMMNRVNSKGGKSVYVMFGSNIKGEHHSSEFDFNEKDLKAAVKVFSKAIVSIDRNI